MASLRNTVSSTLNTVVTAADAVSQTIDTATVGIGMLNKWAVNEAKKQEENLKFDPLAIEEEAKNRVFLRLADLEMEAANYIARSPAHAQAFANAEAKVAAFLANKK